MRKFLILVALAALVPVLSTHAGSPACGDPPSPNENNRGVIASIDVVRLGSAQRSATLVINAFIDIDATPKDAGGKPTKGTSEPEWTFLGDDTAYTVTDTNCFDPRLTGKKDATIIAFMEQDGIKSNEFSITIGKGGSVPISYPTEAESDQFCAWKDSQGLFHCVSGTQNNLKCENIEFPPQCATPNQCVRKTLDQCTGGNPLPPQIRAVQAPPADLGKLIQQLFNWSLSILGVVIFVVIIFSGAQMLIYAGIPAKISDAQGRIQDALLGAALLLAAYLILNVINPNLVGQSTKLPPIPAPAKTTR